MLLCDISRRSRIVALQMPPSKRHPILQEQQDLLCTAANRSITKLLRNYCKGALGGLHLLPVYPSSGDGGFAPLTYKEIDAEMGTWEDIERFSKKYELLMECM